MKVEINRLESIKRIELKKKMNTQPHMWVLSHVWLFLTPWTVAQVPLSMGLPRQEYCNESPFPSPGYPPDPEFEPTFSMSPELGRWILYHWATWVAFKE